MIHFVYLGKNKVICLYLYQLTYVQFDALSR